MSLWRTWPRISAAQCSSSSSLTNPCPALTDVDRSELTGPLLDVPEHLVVNGLPVRGVEHSRHQLRPRDQLGRAHRGEPPFGGEVFGGVGQAELGAPDLTARLV